MIQEYDFDDAYFNDVGSSNDCESNDGDWTDSKSKREEEAKFNLVNPIVREMYAYMQRHYDKQPMRDSVLTGKVYMDEVTEANPAKCYEIFRMTPELLLHLVDKLAQHGYLRHRRGDVNALRLWPCYCTYLDTTLALDVLLTGFSTQQKPCASIFVRRCELSTTTRSI